MHKTTLLFLVASAVLYAAPAHAIVNVLPKVVSRGEDGFGGSIAVSAKIRRGNTDLTQVSGSGTIGYRSGPHLFFITSSGDFGAKGDEAPFTFKDLVHSRYRYAVNDWLLVEGFGQQQFDEVRRLTNRLLAGGGPVFRHAFTDEFVADFGTSVMYVHEEEKNENDEGVPDDALRLSTYLQFRWQLDGHLTLTSTTFYQPRLGEGASGQSFDDYRILSENSLITKVNSWLAVKTALLVSHDSDPPSVDVETTDTSLDLSLVFKF